MQDITVEDLYRHRVLAQLDGVADRSWSVLAVKRADRRRDAYRTTLWLWSGARRVLAVRSRHAPSSARMAPNGERVAFLSKRKRGLMQPMLLRVDDLSLQPVGAASSAWQTLEQWSPDGRLLLLLRKLAWKEDELDDPQSGEGRPRVARHLPYKQDGGGIRAGYRTELAALDVTTGTSRTLVRGDFDVQHAAWSPDGKRLAFIRTRSGSQRHFSDLWLADADGTGARRLTADLAAINQAVWSPDSSRLALAASRLEGDSLAELHLVEADVGPVRRATTTELHLESPAPVWHPDARRIAVVSATRGRHEIAVVDIADGAVERFRHGLRHVGALCASDGALLHVAATMRTLGELHRCDWQGAALERLSRFNRAWFSQRRRPRVAKRAFQVPDGEGGSEQVEAWLLRPAGGEGEPRPVFMDMHGGPQSAALIDFADHLYWYLLVARGWIVVAPNAVGSSGYGDTFARRLRGRWGEVDLPQFLTILGSLRAEGVAGARAACGGKSYGGYLAAWAAGHCDCFETVVVSAPVADVESHFGTSDSGYYVTPYAMEGEIEGHRERYHRLSPLQRIASTSASVLLLQGEDDQRCPLDQSEELFAALIRSGADAALVVYPGGSHSMSATGKPSHRRDYHQRFADWVSGAEAAPRRGQEDRRDTVPRSNTLETGSMERQVAGHPRDAGPR